MKKMLVLAVAFFMTVAASAKSLTLPVSSTVLKAFNVEFGQKADVKWITKNDLFLATFVLNNETVSAWFTEDGELELTQRIVSSDALVPAAGRALQEIEGKATVKAVAEICQQNQFFYLVKAETGKHIITYKILTDGSVTKLDRKKN